MIPSTIIQVSDVAVVTSGNYERFFIGEDGKVYGHIIDPATGHPVENGIALPLHPLHILSPRHPDQSYHRVPFEFGHYSIQLYRNRLFLKVPPVLSLYGHIIDPATGHPVENGIASVSVIASEGKLCDALSTALFVMGLENAQDYWRQHRNYEMILIMEDGDRHASHSHPALSRLPEYFPLCQAMQR